MKLIDVRSLLIPFFIFFSMCISSCRSEEDAWYRIQDEGVLKVGIDPTFPPFEATDGQSFYGIDFDLANALAEQLKLRPEYTYFGYDGLYDALLTGQVDVLVSAMAIFPERTRDFSYSAPYFNAGQVLVFEDSNGVSTPDTLRDQLIPTELGSEGQILALEWQRQKPAIEILTTESADKAIEAMLASRSDVAVTDSISARLFIKDSLSSVSISYVTDESFALVVRAADKLLLEQINKALADLKDSGRLESIISAWLGG